MIPSSSAEIEINLCTLVNNSESQLSAEPSRCPPLQHRTRCSEYSLPHGDGLSSQERFPPQRGIPLGVRTRSQYMTRPNELGVEMLMTAAGDCVANYT